MFSRLDVVVVSIHASAREATKRIWHKNKQTKVSIHASAREATFLDKRFGGLTMFQFTPPHGRRHKVLYAYPAIRQCFNSRLHAGGDKQEVHQYGYRAVSIHASALEATTAANSTLLSLLFQFTPPRGRRLTPTFHQFTPSMFQFTPPRGRRRRSRPCQVPV